MASEQLHQILHLQPWMASIKEHPAISMPAVMLLVLWIVSRVWNKSSQSKSNPPTSSATPSGFPPIDPLPNFNWETTEPLQFRPFKPKYHLTMALSNLAPSDLIPMDKTYKERLALRSSLFTKYPDTVMAVNNDSDPRIKAAVDELYTFVLGTYLPTRYPRMFQLKTTDGKTRLDNCVTGSQIPIHKYESPLKQLEILGQNVDEDFLLLLPDQYTPEKGEEGEKYILEAYTTCYASGFNPREKLGRRLASIHDPVPGYHEKLEKSMDRFFSKLEVGKYVQRVNWSVTVDTGLFAAFGGTHSYGDVEETAFGVGELDVDKTVVRCERQTLHRLPNSKALVFAFHTYTYPLQTIKNEGLGEELAQAIDGLKKGNVPQMHFYKRGPVWGEAVKAFLRS